MLDNTENYLLSFLADRFPDRARIKQGTVRTEVTESADKRDNKASTLTERERSSSRYGKEKLLL